MTNRALTNHLAVVTLTVGSVFFAFEMQAQSTYTRQNNATLLNLAGAWSAGGPPTGTDIAQWNSTSSGNHGTALGGSVTWGQIKIVNPSAGITIANSASATLTLNGVSGVGIDMSAATQNLTINNTMAVGANQTWDVTSGRILLIGTFNLNTTGATLTKAGAGLLDIKATTFTSSTGNFAINGGRVLYGGGAALPSGNLSMNGGILEDYFQGAAFSRTLGTAAGQVQITGGTSGFSESGNSGYWGVSLGTSIQWNNGAGTFNPSEFLLMGSSAQAQTDVGGGTLRNGGITFSSNIDLNGANRTVRVDQQDGGVAGVDRAVTANGAIITGNLTTSVIGGALTKTGVGRLILNPGTGNTYSGGTTISQGTLRFMKLTAMPASGAVAVQSGAIIGINIDGGSAWSTATGTGNGTIGGLLAGNGGQAGGTVTYTGSVGLDLNNVNTQTYTGDIGNPAGTTLTLYKTGNGLLTLSGNSSYTGPTIIQGGNGGTPGGILAVATLANAGVNSPLGAYATPGAGGLSLRNGTFRYTGGTTATDRGFSLDQAGQVSAIDVSGTAGTVLTMGDFAINVYNQTRLSFTGTVGNSLVLGNSTMTKQWYWNTSIPVTVGTVTLSGSQTINNNGNGLLTISSVTGASNPTLTINSTGASGATTVTGAITTGSGGLVQQGGGTLTLLAASPTWSGVTTWGATTSPGVLAIGNNQALGTGGLAVGNNNANSWIQSTDSTARTLANNITISGTSVQFNTGGTGNLTFSGTVALGNAVRTFNIANSSTTLSGVISGTAGNGLTKGGTGALTLSNLNTYNGVTTINAGTLIAGANAPVSANGALGNASSAVLLGATSGSSSAALLTGGAFTIGRAVTVQSGNAGLISLGGNTDNISTFGGAIGLAKDLTVTQVATTGANKLQISGGISGTGAGTKMLTFDNVGLVDVNGTAIADGSGGGNVAVTKDGNGTVRYLTANTYTGLTTVNAGTLVVNSTLSGPVTVNANGTLMGTGAIAGNTTIHGTHSPGNSPGIESFVNLTYGAGADVEWELIADAILTRGTQFDGINVSGNLNFSGATTLTLNFDLAGGTVDWTDAFWSVPHLNTSGWLVYDVAGTTTGFGNLSVTPENWLDNNGATLSSAQPLGYFFLYQDGNDIWLNYDFQVVPEPSGIFLILCGAFTMGWYYRRRHC